MSIATSLDKLSETLTNCKTNLKEKGVEAETIKISDVDEKIAEIQAGGGEGMLGKHLTVTNIILNDSIEIKDENTYNAQTGSETSITVKATLKDLPPLFRNTMSYLLLDFSNGKIYAIQVNDTVDKGSGFFTNVDISSTETHQFILFLYYEIEGNSEYCYECETIASFNITNQG